MPKFCSLRLLLVAFVFCLIPVSSFAGVFISVNFAPPVLPVYEQPPCPEPGWMWTPGYWAYGPDGYYWVPGAWVPAPYEGALWTPGYWGWGDGVYVFHPGYWGRHVGYYGGVNYGFGYMGVGFAGGEWRGHDFAYNTAVMRVNNNSIHNTYVNTTIVRNNTIINNNRVAFSGGPGGIRHDPRPEERMADREQHMAPTNFQHTHESSAMGDRGSYFRNNGGRPSNAAVARPLGFNGNSGGQQQHMQQQQNQQRFQQPQQRQQQQQAQPQQQRFQQPQQRQQQAQPQQQQQQRFQQHQQPQAQPQRQQPQPQQHNAAPQQQHSGGDKHEPR
jgi:hypothetical protein